MTSSRINPLLLFFCLGVLGVSAWSIVAWSSGLKGIFGAGVVIILLVNPIWAVYLCPVLDLWLSGLQAFSLPPRNFIVILLLISAVVWKRQRHDNSLFKIPIQAKYLLTVVLAYYAWLIASTAGMSLFFGSGEENLTQVFYLWPGRVFMGLTLAVLVQYFLTTRRQIQIFMGLTFVALVLSAVVAILQFYDVEFAWKLRSMVGPVNPHHMAAFEARFQRVMGFGSSPINFGYQMVNIFPLVIGVVGGFLLDEKRNWLMKIGLLFCAGILAWTTVISETRALVAGICIATIVVVFRVKSIHRSRSRRIFIQISLFIIIGGASVYSILGVSNYSRWNPAYLSRASQMSRIPVALAGIDVGLQYPFGSGVEGFERGKEEAYERLKAFPGSSYILTTGPHNHFINLMVSGGIPGLFLLVAYFVVLFKLSYSLGLGTSDLFFKTLSAGFIASFSAELVFIQTHNGGPFYGDLIHWYVVGLLLAATRLKNLSYDSSKRSQFSHQPALNTKS